MRVCRKSGMPLIDQGDRLLIFYFERGRESGVRATSVFVRDQYADTNHLTWTCSKFTHHVTDYIVLSILRVELEFIGYNLSIVHVDTPNCLWKKINDLSL